MTRRQRREKTRRIKARKAAMRWVLRLIGDRWLRAVDQNGECVVSVSFRQAIGRTVRAAIH